MAASIDVPDATGSLCRVCGEFFISGHMPSCPNGAAGQPCTWLGAAEDVLRRSSGPLSLDELIHEIRTQGLRFVHARATPKETLRKVLSSACRTPGSSLRRASSGGFYYVARP